MKLRYLILSAVCFAIAVCVMPFIVYSAGDGTNLVDYDNWTHTPLNAYGITYNETTDAYTRTGEISEEAVGASPGDTKLPVERFMRRCVMNDAGVIQYYLCKTDSTLKADCATAANIDGTDGQVMLEVPKFYYSYSYSSPTHSWSISLYPHSGYIIHPAFIIGSTEVDYRYVGAYEAWTDGSTKLASVSGQLPTVTQSRATFRSRAEARGTGWHQMDFYLVSAMQLLFAVEYADFDSQSMIGAGVTDYEAWPSGPQAISGNTNALGNASGNSTLAVDKWNVSTAYSLDDECIPDAAQNGYTYKATVAGTSAGSEPTWPTTLGNTVVDGTVTWTCVRHAGYMAYRGIENWFGHIWKFVDGINVHNSSANGSRVYVAANYTDFADDTDTNYTLITSELSQADGWARTMCPISHGFSPKSVAGGSSATGLADYYYTYFDNNPDIGWRVALRGGSAGYGSFAGAFTWYSSSASSYTSSSVGGRLCFSPASGNEPDKLYFYNGAGTAEQSIGAENGKIYHITYTLADYSGTDNITPQIGGVNGTAVSANGTYSEDIPATGTGNLKFVPGGADLVCTIDTVSVYSGRSGWDKSPWGQPGWNAGPWSVSGFGKMLLAFCGVGYDELVDVNDVTVKDVNGEVICCPQ